MAKLQKYPTVIKLKEIPEEGADFSYDQDTGELTSAIKDLIGSHPYRVNIHIQPMGNLFRLTGSLSTQIDQLCSRCALDITENIQTEFDEILMVDPGEDYTNGSQSRSHFSEAFSEEEPFCNYLKTDEFDVGEFIHEIIAINEPLRPLGSPDCEIACENYNKAIEKGWLQVQDDADSQEKQSPFSVLKGMKLNS